MADKNWTGNKNSIYKTLGASNHTDKEREENDFYATDPIAAEYLIELEKGNLSKNIWEPSCGEGHLSEVFKKAGYDVLSSDLIDRGYPNATVMDFLTYKTDKKFKLDIVTNPPYKYAKDFILKALDLIEEGKLVCMFLKTTDNIFDTVEREDLADKIALELTGMSWPMNGDSESNKTINEYLLMLNIC